MKQNKKHYNVLPFSTKDKNIQNMYFVCRGCTIGKRQIIWQSFASSISNKLDMEINNSYLIFEEEPNNLNDPNAIKIICKGEIFGFMGYVGREFTIKIKEILHSCKSYRIDMINLEDCTNKEIELVLSWK